MKSKNLVLLSIVLALSPCVLAADVAPADRREAAIQDSMDWASGIIQGLGTLAPPPEAAAPAASAPRSNGRSSSRERNKKVAETPAAAATAPANETRQYQYEEKGRYTEVVIKITDRIENGASKNFRLNVTSSQPLTGWTVRLRGAEAVVAQGGLFGESSFSKLIPLPYQPNFVMNLSVKRDGSDWVDFFKLYNEGTVQSQ